MVDDLDAWSATPNEALAWLAALAERTGSSVIATLPEDLVLHGGRVNTAVRSIADVVVELRRPDLNDRASVRAGETDLDVLANREGPTGCVAVAFEGFRRRIVDL